MRLRPSGREKGSRLSFTGLESDSSPAQFTTQFYQAPVVSTFVEKQGLSLANRMNFNGVSLEVVGERLFDIKKGVEGSRLIRLQLVENTANISGILHRAVKICGEMLYS